MRPFAKELVNLPAGALRAISKAASSAQFSRILPQRAEEDAAQDDDANWAMLIDRQLILPVAPETGEEASRATWQDKGQFLARQDRWEELAQLIRNADHDRAATPCSMSLAELLCYGARADVVQATEDAIIDGANPTLAGIEALENLLHEHEDDYAIAVIVALAHTDIGWAWRGGGWPHEIPDRNLQLFLAHFQRAEQILDTFGGVENKFPLLAAARCTLLAAQTEPKIRLADDYEKLINLNPANPRPMRAMGNHLLPRWFGSYEQLELEARRTAARTGDTWGNGAYTWVFMDALAVDPGAARIVDIDFFIDGLRDILEHRPDQHIANTLAAYAGIVMGPDRTPTNAPDLIRTMRARIHEALDWILNEHLYEMHPLVWAQAAIGPDLNTPLPQRSALIRRGIDAAHHMIAQHFESELRRGTTVAFSKHGLRLYPAS